MESLGARFRVERELGRGGMGVVLLAHDNRLDRRVAVKVLSAEHSATIDGDRFAREIRVTARLVHPNIVPLFDSGSVEGQRYFVMPFVDGPTLRTHLIGRGTLTPRGCHRLRARPRRGALIRACAGRRARAARDRVSSRRAQRGGARRAVRVARSATVGGPLPTCGLRRRCSLDAPLPILTRYPFGPSARLTRHRCEPLEQFAHRTLKSGQYFPAGELVGDGEGAS